MAETNTAPGINEPERWWMLKESIEAAQAAITIGIENTVELLEDHETRLGRTTKTNRLTAERMEMEIAQMETALEAIQAPSPLTTEG